MKIQKFILTLATLLVAESAAAAGLKTAPEFTFYPGYVGEIPVSADLPQGTTALQFTVSLPAPLIPASIDINNEAAPDHTSRVYKENDNTYNFVLYSNANTPFTGAGDFLFRLNIKPDAAATRGDYSVQFSKVIASNAEGVETRLADSSVEVKVRIPVESLTVEPRQASIVLGEELRIAATVSPGNADSEVAWEVSSPEVISVDNNGLVRGLAIGTARVTARSTTFPGISDYCDVTVNPVKATGISLDKEYIELIMGSTATLTATVSPANTTNPSVEWSSSDKSIVTVDDKGVITAIKPGQAVVMAFTTDGSELHALCPVNVLPPPATSIVLSQTQLDLTVKVTAVLTAKVMPAEAAQTIKWESSNTDIATVGADGTVTAIAAGSAIIVANTTDGSGVHAICEVNVTDALVSSITLDKTALGLRIGQSETIVATVLPDYAGNRRLQWTSDNSAVATVNDNGKVTAFALGEANITAAATDGSGVKASCKVTVTKALATGVTLDITEATLRVRESVKLTATVSPAGAVNAVNWSSSAPAIATVDAEGNVTAIAAGKAVITATTADGTDLTATCSITVEPALVESITLDKERLELKVGESALLKVTVLPDYAGNHNVNWTSSDEKVASVASGGTVTAKSTGAATITATAADGSGIKATCSVNVTDALVSSITLDKTALGLRIGQSETIVATVLPDYAGNRRLQWISDNSAVAIVDDNGKVTALALGEANITAAATDGSGVKASCKVTVTNALATGVILDITEATLRVRESVKLTATVSPAGAVNAVNWSSSAPAIATVDAEGCVTAIAAGKAVITATTADGTDLAATCYITVEPALVESITLDRNEITMTVGDSETLVATVLPVDAGNSTVIWQSSDTEVAIVDSNGRVIALAEGTATITATAADGSGAYDQCMVIVERAKATSIVIDPREVSIEQEQTVQVSAIVLPAEAVQDVNWSSLNTDIAAVDAEGIITALEVGTTVITATTTDGSDLTASCLVTVTELNGVFSVVCDNMVVIVENGTDIVIRGLPYDEPVKVVNLAGACVYSGTERRISGLSAGIYIIIAENRTLKVILN